MNIDIVLVRILLNKQNKMLVATFFLSSVKLITSFKSQANHTEPSNKASEIKIERAQY